MEKEPADSFLKPLQHLQQVDAPPFLLTRIRQAIDAVKYERVPRAKAVLAGIAFCALLVVNTFVLLQAQQPLKKAVALQSFDLLPDNDIYK